MKSPPGTLFPELFAPVVINDRPRSWRKASVRNEKDSLMERAGVESSRFRVPSTSVPRTG